MRSMARAWSRSVMAALTVVMLLALPGQSKAGPGDPAPAAPPRPGRIVGIVVDEARHPVAEASVAMINVLGVPVKRVQTDAQGRYDFGPVRPGLWLVRALKRDVGGDQERAGVRPGETVRVPMQLHKP